jgi:uncharacterized protein
MLVPVADGIFTQGPEPHLIGGRCTTCGVVSFPRADGCANCTGVSIESHDLPRHGTLWTWTIQGFLPKNPPYAGKETAKEFVPYGVGYVDLGEVKVEARLTVADTGSLRIGMPLELVLIPFTTDDDGNDILTFAFAPSTSPSSSPSTSNGPSHD